MDEFIPSEGNQAVLRLVRDLVDVEWLVHFDIGETTVPVAAPVIEILRWGVADEKTSVVEKWWTEHRHDPSHAIYGPSAFGWRVDMDEGKKEFVVFCGRDDQDEHSGLAESKGWDDERNQMRELVESYTAVYVRVLDI